jgi:hypothetical protein
LFAIDIAFATNLGARSFISPSSGCIHKRLVIRQLRKLVANEISEKGPTVKYAQVVDVAV